MELNENIIKKILIKKNDYQKMFQIQDKLIEL